MRIGWKRANPTQYAMYFHCQTNLVETFRTLFPADFRFEGNRALLFDEAQAIPEDALEFCIAASLTYRLRKRSAAATLQRTGKNGRGKQGRKRVGSA